MIIEINFDFLFKIITFLGPKPYLECDYYFCDPQAEFYPTRFVQTSLIRQLVLSGESNEVLEILILVNGKVKERNAPGRTQSQSGRAATAPA